MISRTIIKHAQLASCARALLELKLKRHHAGLILCYNIPAVVSNDARSLSPLERWDLSSNGTCTVVLNLLPFPKLRPENGKVNEMATIADTPGNGDEVLTLALSNVCRRYLASSGKGRDVGFRERRIGKSFRQSLG